MYTTRAHRVASDQYVAVTVVTKGSRREARYRLRQLNRDVTSLGKAVQTCGMPLGVADVVMKMAADRVAYYAGLTTCGNLWACPVCSAKIRAFRATEIAEGLRHLITDLGGGALFPTMTLPHQAGDNLARTVELVSDGFSAVQRGRPYARERADNGIMGHIRAFEVTHGLNGWHPHLHALLCLDRPATAVAAAGLEAAWQERWNRWLARNNWPTSAPGVGVKIRVVRSAADLGQYLAKVQEGALGRYQTESHAGYELARGDLKPARERTSRVPFEILADFGNTGLALDLGLWHTYEGGTKGRSAIRWGKGLRGILLPAREELSDEDVAAAEQEGTAVALIRSDLWAAIERRSGLSAVLLAAAESGGFHNLLAVLVRSGLPTDGLLRPMDRP